MGEAQEKGEKLKPEAAGEAAGEATLFVASERGACGVNDCNEGRGQTRTNEGREEPKA
jgi:hypothetical protein